MHFLVLPTHEVLKKIGITLCAAQKIEAIIAKKNRVLPLNQPGKIARQHEKRKIARMTQAMAV